MANEVQIVPITEELVADYHRAVDAVAREGRYLARTTAPPIEDAKSFARENITGARESERAFCARR
jgi:hypothetical protein